jgi:hypothetical protein
MALTEKSVKLVGIFEGIEERGWGATTDNCQEDDFLEAMKIMDCSNHVGGSFRF